MKKITINIENSELFELMIDGDVSNITIETDKGIYDISKNFKKRDAVNRKRELRAMMSDDMIDGNPKRILGVKGESRYRR